MKSDKDEAATEGEAEVAKVAVLDAKTFEDSIKTGKLQYLCPIYHCDI